MTYQYIRFDVFDLSGTAGLMWDPEYFVSFFKLGKVKFFQNIFE